MVSRERAAWLGAKTVEERWAPLALSRQELIETLCRLYDAQSPNEKSKIDARFKSLQKVGLPSGTRATKGQKLKYDIAQICEIVMCFEFAQLGLDAWFVKRHLIRPDDFVVTTDDDENAFLRAYAAGKKPMYAYLWLRLLPVAFSDQIKGGQPPFDTDLYFSPAKISLREDEKIDIHFSNSYVDMGPKIVSRSQCVINITKVAVDLLAAYPPSIVRPLMDKVLTEADDNNRSTHSSDGSASPKRRPAYKRPRRGS